MGKVIAKIASKIPMLLILVMVIITPLFEAQAYVSVKGYYRKNGTYVAPHVRSNPNGIKYDNYSYKPSQGLYNDTYGTRGTTWDTPTWTTDPDYYVGKAIYDGSSSMPVIKYTPPVPVVVPKPVFIAPAPVVKQIFQVPATISSERQFKVKTGLGGNKVFTEMLLTSLVPGRTIKAETSNQVYVGDSSGCLRWVTNEQVAKRLFGASWNASINLIDDSLLASYKICDPIYE